MRAYIYAPVKSVYRGTMPNRGPVIINPIKRNACLVYGQKKKKRGENNSDGYCEIAGVLRSIGQSFGWYSYARFGKESFLEKLGKQRLRKIRVLYINAFTLSSQSHCARISCRGGTPTRPIRKRESLGLCVCRPCTLERLRSYLERFIKNNYVEIRF